MESWRDGEMERWREIAGTSIASLNARREGRLLGIHQKDGVCKLAIPSKCLPALPPLVCPDRGSCNALQKMI